MSINLIVAMTKDRVIGLDNKLPWRIPDEMKNFKELTIGNTVIMGRNTYESIPEKYRPLPNRDNIVVSSQMNSHQSDYNGIIIVPSLREAISRAKQINKEIFIMGGSKLYESAIPFVDKMYISMLKGDYKGNVYFPEIDMTQWDVEIKQRHPEFDLVLFSRMR